MEAGDVVNGKYTIERLLGAGGMGSVYEARDPDGQIVALKVISAGDLSSNPVLVARFQREAKAASAIDTKHIVRMIDTGTDEESGMPYMAMELLKGEDTQQLIDRFGALPPELALRLTAQACVGLHKAHETRVIHRDIKPANLYIARVEDDGIVVKLLDFGVAKVRQDANTVETAGLTRTGSMLGSPLYMSPEQARGHKTIDHRADIWSLGIVLYQMLCGRTPHHDIDALGELIIAICSDPPQPVQERAPWVEPGVAAIVHKALRFDPGDRFQTAQEMYDAIEAVLPDGIDVDEESLRAVNAEEKKHVATKLSPVELGAPPPVRPSQAPPPEPAQAMSADDSGPNLASQPPPPSAETAGTNEGVTQSQTSPQPAKSSSLGVIMAAVALVAIAAVSYMAFKPAEAESDPAVPAAPTEARTTAPPVESMTVSPSPEKPPRTVKVVIVPSDATVELGGKVVESKNGIIEISGMLGSQHKIRIYKGDREQEEEIVIAEGGAIPPKVELAAEKKPKGGGGIRPPAPPPPATPPPAAPPPPPPPSEIDKEFK